jgi:outer membrane immunogenic protein
MEPMEEVVAAPGYSWQGFYLGGFGGFAWGDYTFDYNPPDVGGDTDGWLAGGEVGANLQWNSIVLGAEGDIAWTSIEGSNSCPNPAFNCDSEINWFSTLRGRVGVAAGRFHIFGTGGLAIADVRAETVNLAGLANPPSGTPVNGEDNILFGWAAGAGAEVMLGSPTNRWTVKADWLYYDLDEDPFDIDNGLVVNVGHTGNMVRVHVTKLLP